MPYYITATNNICDGQAVNLAYQMALKEAGNWYDNIEDAKKEVEERRKRGKEKNT